MNEQLVAKKIGDSGCYFLSLVKVAETISKKNVDIFRTYANALANNWIQEDLYIVNPDRLLKNLTGKTCVTEKSTDLNYKPKENEYLIGCYERKEVGRTFSHFVVLDSKKKVIYDPYGTSLTVKKGSLVSLRIIKVK